MNAIISRLFTCVTECLISVSLYSGAFSIPHASLLALFHARRRCAFRRSTGSCVWPLGVLGAGSLWHSATIGRLGAQPSSTLAAAMDSAILAPGRLGCFGTRPFLYLPLCMLLGMPLSMLSCLLLRVLSYMLLCMPLRMLLCMLLCILSMLPCMLLCILSCMLLCMCHACCRACCRAC